MLADDRKEKETSATQAMIRLRVRALELREKNVNVLHLQNIAVAGYRSIYHRIDKHGEAKTRNQSSNDDDSEWTLGVGTNSMR